MQDSTMRLGAARWPGSGMEAEGLEADTFLDLSVNRMSAPLVPITSSPVWSARASESHAGLEKQVLCLGLDTGVEKGPSHGLPSFFI